jgi:cytochrome c oxidase subunit 3
MTKGIPVLEPPRRIPDRPIGPGGPRVVTGDDGSAAARPPASAAAIAVWLLVGSVTVLFAAVTSALLARRAEADWRVGPLPAVLWLSTAVLLASSAAVEWARRAGRPAQTARVRRGFGAGLILGLAFLGLQVTAWRQLAAMGIFLASNPHSSYFYLLTGLHGLHIVGGLAGLAFAAGRAGQGAVAAADPAAVFWHFLTVLWLYLLAILFAL